MDDETNRILQEYAARNADKRITSRYQFTNPGHLLLVQQRERALLALLGQHGLAERLGQSRILDVGCGTGGLLVDMLRYGASMALLAGIDLVPDHIQQARARLPLAALHDGSATELPFADASFDIVCQMTVLTTILDSAIRQRVAAEMRRVVREDGLIVWYDLRRNSPRNRGVQAISPAAIRRLFPGCAVAARPLTLAPPLARLIAPRAWWLATLLQNIGPLQTHLLAGIQSCPPAPLPDM